MMKLKMAVYREKLAGPIYPNANGVHNAIWVVSGCLFFDGKDVAANQGVYLSAEKISEIEATADTEILRFELRDISNSDTSVFCEQMVLSSEFNWSANSAFLRLDQVSFPPAACAYRHVHPGAGIRYLTEGALEIHSDHSLDMMKEGDAWFEDINSPVQARAPEKQTASFVRAMILPQEFFGKPTLQYLDPADESKPRLQTNQRFFDQVLTF